MTILDFRKMVFLELSTRCEALDWVALDGEDYESIFAEVLAMDDYLRRDPVEPRAIGYASPDYFELGVQSFMLMGIAVTRKDGVTP